MANSTHVLLVDDEVSLADLYATWIEDSYAVATAYGGEEALEKIDSETDVILLDRRMPRISGDDVLEEIRAGELDCRIAMVTAVDPEFDILEMPFDDYLSKPVSEAELKDVVDRLSRLTEYDRRFQQYFSLVSKRATIETEKRPEELRSNEEYNSLIERIDSLEEKLDTAVGNFEGQDLMAAFSDF